MDGTTTAAACRDQEAERLQALVALQATALESMAHGLCMVDAEQRVVLFNQRFSDMFGLPPGAARVGMPMRELIDRSAACGNFPASQADEVYRRRITLMARGKPFELRRQLSRGRTFSMHYRPMANGGWITLVEDVSERQRQEYELRVQFERYDQAINQMSHGMCAVDAEYRLVLFNQRFLDMYGLTSDIVRIGVPMREVIEHAAKIGFFRNATPDVVWQRLVDKMAPGEPYQLNQRLHGREYVIHSHPMQDGGWVTLCEDVTDRKRMEEELREQNMLFDTALENMAHGLCVFDKDWRVIVRNRRYLDMYGITPAEVPPGTPLIEVVRRSMERGVHVSDIGPEEFFADFKQRVAESGNSVLHRRIVVGGRLLAVRHQPMENGGWVGTFEDVTEREQAAEELSEQYRRFDVALNNMAHGLCMFGADERLIVCNARYLDMYQLDPAVVKPGIAHRDLLAHWISAGNEPGTSVEAFHRKRTAAIAGRRTSTMLLRRKDGRVIEATSRPTPDGGWVSGHEDVTERLGYEQALRDRNMLFDAALENMAHGICVFDKDWRVVVRNKRYLDIYGMTQDDARPGTPAIDLVRHSLAHGVHTSGQSAEEFYEDFRRRMTVDKEPVVHRRLSNGRLIAVRHRPMENGGWVGTFEDVTERERAAEELAEQYRRFDVALNNMTHGLCMFDADMRLIVSNGRYAEMFNLPPDLVRPGMSVREVMAQSVAIGNYRHTTVTADELYDSYVKSLHAGDMNIQRHLADGRIIKITHQPMVQGGWVAIYEDITERHRAEESIAHMARHDALTDLPNRVLLREKMAEGLARVEAAGEQMAVFYLDLDNFKGVNDTLGHAIGDRLLGTIAQRVRGAVGEADTVARLGGDEFAIVQCNASARSAEMLARALVEIVSEPVMIDGQEINTGVSVGVAMAPGDGTAADHLMKCADLALYRAKAEGRAMYRFFEPDMDARIQARRALELDLRHALAAGEFTLVFQPQISLATDRLAGMEALLRWTHAERGAVPPSEFIPLAEETGLIVPLGEWVLRQACAEAARWPDPITVAVNLSPVQFRNRSLVATVTHALAAARLSPHRLELEITEAVLLQDDEAIVTMLHQLRALGVRISMDDFGTGYSSLSYLRSFPFDKIKIDRSFIKDIERSRDSASIIRAIASLGASLGIETTAEGIETDEQLDLVRRAGCTEMQGYLVSRPVPAAELTGLIARYCREEAAA